MNKKLEAIRDDLRDKWLADSWGKGTAKARRRQDWEQMYNLGFEHAIKAQAEEYKGLVEAAKKAVEYYYTPHLANALKALGELDE